MDKRIEFDRLKGENIETIEENDFFRLYELAFHFVDIEEMTKVITWWKKKFNKDFWQGYENYQNNYFKNNA